MLPPNELGFHGFTPLKGWDAQMNAQTLEARAAEFLDQKRIAIAGVSRDNSHHPVGNLIYRRLKETGHTVIPVNPKLEVFEGQQCYSNVQAIPEQVDGVVIITRPEATEKVVRDCATKGVKRVWMHQSVASSTSVSPTAVAFCKDNGIEVIAGGCPMMFGPGADFGHRCMKWFLKATHKLPV